MFDKMSVVIQDIHNMQTHTCMQTHMHARAHTHTHTHTHTHNTHTHKHTHSVGTGLGDSIAKPSDNRMVGTGFKPWCWLSPTAGF